jgi:hypothetical protein
MLKTSTTILLFFILTSSFAQKQRKVSTYLFAGYNKTIYDITLGNNPSGIGLGLQAFLNNKTKFKPTIELADYIYLENDKVMRLTNNSKPIDGVRSMVNLFVGSSFHPTQKIYFSFVAGPAFINGQTLLGIKPSFGFYFSEKKKWTGRVSYINVFNRNKSTKNNFGSICFAIGLKLF